MRLLIPRLGVFALVLLAMAEPARAVAPPFTISFTAAQYSGLERNGPGVVLTRSGTLPNEMLVSLRVTEISSGHLSGRFLIGMSNTQGNESVSIVDDDVYYNPAAPSCNILPAPAPTIKAIPSRITLGSEFAVTGADLLRSLTYTLGPATLQPIALTNTSTTFRAPTGVGTGTLPFTISDHGSVAVSRSVDVAASGLTAGAILPQCAAQEGGGLITISGNGFEDGAAVQFGSTYSPQVVVKDRFTIMAKLPPWFGNAHPVIIVFNPDGSQATLTNAFTYKSDADGGCGSGGGRHRAAGH